MQADEFEKLLRRWARVYGWPKPDEWDEDDSGGLQGQTHVLLAAIRADGKAALKLDASLSRLRDRLRRRRMAEARKNNEHGDPREKLAEHRCYGAETRGGAKPMRVHPEADHVDHMVCQLFEHNPVLGVIIRIEYCTRGRHRDKATWAGSILDTPHLTIRQYRMYLEHARIWLNGAISATGKKVARVT